MPNELGNMPTEQTRKQAAEEINMAMARFPLILQILEELGKTSYPFPGDDDVRHGCERALTRILSELARIKPAGTGKSCKAEETALMWLQRPEIRRLIDADRLERMQQFIDSILKPS